MIVQRALSLDMSKRWDECNEDAMDSFLKSDTNDTTSSSTKPSPYAFPVTSQATLHPTDPSRKPACLNFLGLQHQIHPFHPSLIFVPNSTLPTLAPECHQNPSNHSVANTTAQVSALHKVPLLPIDATTKGAVGLTLVDSAPLCMLPIITDLDLKSPFDPIPTNITTPVNAKLLCQVQKPPLSKFSIC